jgi:hypothetical protein
VEPHRESDIVKLGINYYVVAVISTGVTAYTRTANCPMSLRVTGILKSSVTLIQSG